MRAICINNRDTGYVPPLIEGEIYNITKEFPCANLPYGLIGCELEEMGERYIYNRDRFIPLSDKDEREYADEIMESIFEPSKIN